MRFGSLLLLALLGGCGATVPQVVRETPPAALLTDCPEPPALVSTNGQLAQWALDLQTALRLCNNDKAALREWAENPDGLPTLGNRP